MEEFKQRCRKIGILHFHYGEYPFMREGVNKVALCLFEHNEKAYKSVIRMMEQYSKSCYCPSNRHRKELHCK